MSIPNQKLRAIARFERMLRDLSLGNFKMKVSQHQTVGSSFLVLGHGLPFLWMALSIQISLVGLFQSNVAQANPEFVFARDVEALVSKPRSSIVVIFNAGSKGKPDFRMQRPVIVPVSEDGKMVWFKDDAWKSKPVETRDRFIIEKDMLGSRVTERFYFKGCEPRNGLIVSRSQGVAWLASCPEEVTKQIDSSPARVVYDGSKGSVASRFYDYKFKKDNHMLFDEVSLKSSSDTIVARDSDLYIRSDIRNFFTLNFSSADIESKLINKRIEPLTALASLGFYLKVLFFSLTLDLRTDVAFFESSANIPMVLTLPVNAAKRLNRKSGILYSFRLGNVVSKESLRVGMPALDPLSLVGDFKQAGLAYCADYCQYELSVPAADKHLKMRIVMNRKVVEKGLFPWFVQDVASMQKDMNWSLPGDLDLTGRVGLYFEVSKMPKGSHVWDFWISF